MRRLSPVRRRWAALVLASAIGSFGLTVASAAAAEPQTAAAGSDTERWKGGSCTAFRCAPRPGSTWGAAAGFGIAVGAAGWLSRRQR
ncbi:MAG: hypothetical protein ACE5FL_08645 [Myxococcota bacterium]